MAVPTTPSTAHEAFFAWPVAQVNAHLTAQLSGWRLASTVDLVRALHLFSLSYRGGAVGTMSLTQECVVDDASRAWRMVLEWVAETRANTRIVSGGTRMIEPEVAEDLMQVPVSVPDTYEQFMHHLDVDLNLNGDVDAIVVQTDHVLPVYLVDELDTQHHAMRGRAKPVAPPAPPPVLGVRRITFDDE